MAAQYDDGLQILDVTDPANPVDAAIVRDTAYTELNSAHGITTLLLGNNHYAMVASLSDAGVQVIDITDPNNPENVVGLAYGLPHYDPFSMLKGVTGITTVEIDSKHYAFVAAMSGNSMQVIGITNPFKTVDVVDEELNAEQETEPEQETEQEPKTTTAETDPPVVVTQEPVNVVPVANAGTDQAVVEGTTVRLDGSASTDPDQDTLTYSWSHDSTLVTLNGAVTANLSFVVANVA